MNPAIFLDRDGVIIENRSHYVRSWADVEIFPQALEALARLAGTRYKIVLVTNQSAVGRGLIARETAEEINRRLLKAINAAGGQVHGTYMCPHTPSDGCECRKPRPGMLLRAAQDLSIDLKSSIMIGDALTDLQAGRAAGLHRVALVRTGRGASQLQQPRPEDLGEFPVFDDLKAAVNSLLCLEE